MTKKIRTRAIIIILVTLVGLYLIFLPHNRKPGMKDLTSWAQVKENLQNNIHLGLDLRGGSHLVLQVQTDDVIKGITAKNADAARAKMNEKGWQFNDINNSVDTITITLPDSS